MSTITTIVEGKGGKAVVVHLALPEDRNVVLHINLDGASVDGSMTPLSPMAAVRLSDALLNAAETIEPGIVDRG